MPPDTLKLSSEAKTDLKNPCSIRVTVACAPFDGQAARAELLSSVRTGAVGAVVSFLGLCRDEGGALVALEIEHFPDMAQAEIARIASKAALRWPIQALHIIHRYGRLEVGEEIVLVMVAAAHRGEAFEAAEWVMDCLKTNAPFWKKQHWQGNRPPDWVVPNPDDLEQR